MCWTLWKYANTHSKYGRDADWLDYKRGDLVNSYDDHQTFGVLPTRPWFRILVHPGLHKSAFDEWKELDMKGAKIVALRKYYLGIDDEGLAGQELRRWMSNPVVQLSPDETAQLLTLKRERRSRHGELVESWRRLLNTP